MVTTTIQEVQDIIYRDYSIRGSHVVDPDTLIVDVDGDVVLRAYNLALEVQFGKVTGNFKCRDKHLKTLKGAPDHVGGEFDCAANALTNLTHGPQSTGSYNCGWNKLTSLVGAPLKVNGQFLCRSNLLTSLTHAPAGITFLDCQDNPLKVMEGVPADVGSISCSWQQDLPLLRLLTCESVYLGWECPQVVNEIMTKYEGQGKPGAIKAAAELIRAGYRENARW